MCERLSRPDLNRTAWLAVSFRAAAELWLPELRLAGLVSAARPGLAGEEGGLQGGLQAGQLRVRGDRTLHLTHRLQVQPGLHHSTAKQSIKALKKNKECIFVFSPQVRTQCRLTLARFPHDTQVSSSQHLV